MSSSNAPSEFARPDHPGDLTPFIRHLMRGGTLSLDEASAALEEMVTGQSHPAEMGAFLALLAQRVPTADEIAGAATVMRRHVDALKHDIAPERLLDTAGTGGAPKTFNVSTGAAIVAAGAGVPVAKGGNRSRTGRGSAEVLAALGVNVDAGREVQRQCLTTAGVCFCFAVHHHPAARHAMPVRKALGFPTIFNVLGPLCNPAGARRHLVGVYDRALVLPVANALRTLGAVRALVVHSEDGLDEVSIGAPTIVADVSAAGVGENTLTPEEIGLERGDPLHDVPSDCRAAAELLTRLLGGRMGGPHGQMLLASSAAALVAGGAADDLRAGVDLARKTIESGAAMRALDRLRATSSGE